MWFWQKKNKTSSFDISVHLPAIKDYTKNHYVASPPPRDSNIQYSLRGGEIKYSLRGDDDVDLLRSQYLSWEKEQRTRNTFSSLVLNHMAVKMISPSTFCRRAGIDRKLFSKLKTDFCYSPKKDTAIRYCLALQLSLDDANALLKSAGFALSNSSSYDLAIQYCLEHHVHELAAVNMLLEALDEKVFSYEEAMFHRVAAHIMCVLRGLGNSSPTSREALYVSKKKKQSYGRVHNSVLFD